MLSGLIELRKTFEKYLKKLKKNFSSCKLEKVDLRLKCQPSTRVGLHKGG